jgi:hypothetical protein
VSRTSTYNATLNLMTRDDAKLQLMRDHRAGHLGAVVTLPAYNNNSNISYDKGIGFFSKSSRFKPEHSNNALPQDLNFV